MRSCPAPKNTLLGIYVLERPDLLQSAEMARPGISTKNTEKNTPQAEILEPQEKTPQNTEKNTQDGHFW